MTPTERKKMAGAIAQAHAISALEGLEPTADMLAVDEAILNGKVTLTQYSDELLEYVKLHKTGDGFNESRSWL